MAFDAQKQIRENTLELQEYLKGLKQWETQVKEKDKKLKSQTLDNVANIPPVRGYGGAESRRNVSHIQPTKGEIKVSHGGDIETKTRISLPEKSRAVTAAKHTYDHFHEKWDKFDVDAALKQVDEEDLSAATNFQEDKKKKKVQKASGPVNHIGGSSFTSLPQASEKPAAKEGNVNGFSSVLKPQSSDLFINATSEKEMGNNFFKEKKFVQAIECYSRSIALQPSAVSYANRAMAYIKIRRFKEAELDCTEALALDDRYIKAYSRRGTARKELGNYMGAVADAEFALRLEPDNKELKEQYMDAKAMSEKNISAKHEEKKVPIPIEEVSTRTISETTKKGEAIRENSDLPPKDGSANHPSPTPPGQRSGSEQLVESSQAAIASAQAVAASIVAARAMTHTAIAAPKTFYEFEAAWKSFSTNPAQQAELLKVIKPSSLPQLFKDNLSPKLLGEIIRSLEHLFPDNASHAIEVLESLTMAKRFSLTAMCLTSKEKADLRKLWEEVFVGSQVDNGRVEILNGLRQKFQL
eukprot:c17658_g1_i2 orf=292-1866(+)